MIYNIYKIRICQLNFIENGKHLKTENQRSRISFLTHFPSLSCFHVPFVSCCLGPCLPPQFTCGRQGHTSPFSLQGADRFHHSNEPKLFVWPRAKDTETFCHTFRKKTGKDTFQTSANQQWDIHWEGWWPLTCVVKGTIEGASQPLVLLIPNLETHMCHKADVTHNTVDMPNMEKSWLINTWKHMQGVTEYSGMVVLFHLWKAKVKHQECECYREFSYKSRSMML